MEGAYKAGKVRAIGVSNFYPDRFIDLFQFMETESWGPFAEGKNDFFTNETLSEIGEKYGKSVAQVFNFELTSEDMDRVLKLNQEQSLFFSHYDPEIVEFLTGLGK